MVRVFAVSLVAAAAAVGVAACPGRPAALGCVNDDDCPAGFCVEGLCSDLAAGGEGEGESNGGEGEANEGEGDVVGEGEGDVVVVGEGEGEGAVDVAIAPAPTQNSSSTLTWSSSSASCVVTVDGVATNGAGSGEVDVAFLAGDVEVSIACAGEAVVNRTFTPALPGLVSDDWPDALRAGETRRGFRVDVDVTAASAAFAQPKSVSFRIVELFAAAGLNEVPARTSIVVKDGAADVASYLSDVAGGERLFIAVPSLAASAHKTFAVYLDAGTFTAPAEWIEESDVVSIDVAADANGDAAAADLGFDLGVSGWAPDATDSLELSSWAWSVDGQGSDVFPGQRTALITAPTRLLHRNDALAVAEVRSTLTSGATLTQFVSAHRETRMMRALLLVRGAINPRVAFYIDPDLGSDADNDVTIGRGAGADFFNDNFGIGIVGAARVTPAPDLVFVDDVDRASDAWDINDLDHGALDGSADSETGDISACLVWSAVDGALDVEVDWSDTLTDNLDIDRASARAAEQMSAVGSESISVGRVWRLVP